MTKKSRHVVVEIRDAHSGDLVRALNPRIAVAGLAFSPDCQSIVAVADLKDVPIRDRYQKSKLVMWSTTTGSELQTWKALADVSRIPLMAAGLSRAAPKPERSASGTVRPGSVCYPCVPVGLAVS